MKKDLFKSLRTKSVMFSIALGQKKKLMPILWMKTIF